MRRVAGNPKSALPLKYRLANPPPIFVGRVREVELVTQAIRRAPVTVITGPGGLGKTALALEALHRDLAPEPERTLMISVAPNEPAAQVRLEILRALAASTDHDPLDWAEFQRAPEQTSALVVDIAEKAGAWVLLDDVHHADGDELRSLLAAIARYGRKCRFIATSRGSLGLRELGGQEVPLERMDDETLADLARKSRPGEAADRVREAVRAARGSPWLLHQYLAAGVAGVELSKRQLLDGVADEGIELLDALAMLTRPFDERELRALRLVIHPELVDELTRRGLLARAPSGLKVHDAVRTILDAPTERIQQWARSAADVLIGWPDADGVLEGVRLLFVLGDTDRAVTTLEREGHALIRDGYAPRLWSIICDAHDPRLEPFRLLCAAELGNPTALAQVDEPSSDDPAQKLAWAHTRFAQGDVSAVASIAAQVLRAAMETGNQSLAAEAALLRAECLRRRGHLAAAVAQLAELVPPSEAHALRRDSLHLRCAVEAGEAGVTDGLRNLMGDIRRRPASLDALVDAAHAARAIGDRDAAWGLTEMLRAMPRGSRSQLLAGRRALLLTASLHLEGGALERAAQLLGEMDRYTRGPNLVRPAVGVLRARLALAWGDVMGLDQTLPPLVAEAERTDASLAQEAAAILVILRSLRGDLAAAEPRRVPAELERGPAARVLSLRRHLHRLRHGLPTTRSDRALSESDVETGAAGVLVLMVRATDALVNGEAERALRWASDAAHHAARVGHGILRGEALELACDAAACTQTRTQLDRLGAELAALAAEMGSPRFAGSADLHLALAEEPVSMGRLERAISNEASPIAMRRARSLFGDESPLDRIDSRVLERERSRGGVGEITIVVAPESPDSSTERWGLDRRRESVWTADGRSVDLAQTPLLWRILEVMADRGGRATKEELVLHAWGENEYHKLKDKGRLHVALRKLRELIEEDPSSPTRVVTADGAYAMGGLVRARR